MCGFLPPPPPQLQPLFPTPASFETLSKEKKRLDSNYLSLPAQVALRGIAANLVTISPTYLWNIYLWLDLNQKSQRQMFLLKYFDFTTTSFSTDKIEEFWYVHRPQTAFLLLKKLNMIARITFENGTKLTKSAALFVLSGTLESYVDHKNYGVKS